MNLLVARLSWMPQSYSVILFWTRSFLATECYRSNEENSRVPSSAPFISHNLKVSQSLYQSMDILPMRVGSKCN